MIFEKAHKAGAGFRLGEGLLTPRWMAHGYPRVAKVIPVKEKILDPRKTETLSVPRAFSLERI